MLLRLGQDLLPCLRHLLLQSLTPLGFVLQGQEADEGGGEASWGQKQSVAEYVSMELISIIKKRPLPSAMPQGFAALCFVCM